MRKFLFTEGHLLSLKLPVTNYKFCQQKMLLYFKFVFDQEKCHLSKAYISKLITVLDKNIFTILGAKNVIKTSKDFRLDISSESLNLWEN